MDVKEKSKKKYGKYEDYEIESAARTLEEAEQIKEDKEKMTYVLKCLSKKQKATDRAVKSLSDLREIGNEIEDEDEE